MFVDTEPEDQLCLMLARRDLSGEVRERTLQLLSSPLRWPLFLEHAKQYDICPIIYQSLEILGFRSVPDPIRTELAKIFGVNAIRCEALGKETARILQLLGDAGIPVMPLKGIALAASLYHDPALRVCADIDILVPPQHAADAFHLIVAAGYQSEFTQVALLDLFVRYSKDCLLMRQDDICMYPLELHCALLWGGQLERDLLTEIWAQANRKTFYGVEAFALSEEWEFLYLTLHAARHGLSSLKWLVDLDRLCSRRPDWERVMNTARLWGWEDAVRSTLAECVSLFDTPISPALRLKTPSSGERWSRSSDLRVLTQTLLSLQLLKTARRKIRFLAIRLFIPTPADCEFLVLPSWLFFLYYPLRPFRVTCKLVWWIGRAGFILRSDLRWGNGTDGLRV
jgi:Uncharacterised nucleotidyltransferase